MIPIFIPTRARVLHQVTWESIGDEARQWAYLVCPEIETKSHEAFGRTTLSRGDIQGINNVRNFIIEYAYNKGMEKIIILDDDLIFGTRLHHSSPSLRKTKQIEMVVLWEKMEKLLEEFVHVGVSPRQMNDKHFPHTIKYCMRQNAVHGIQPSVLMNEGIHYNDVSLMEDYYITLKLFEAGFPNAVIVDWTWDQRGASGAKGGCSLYRTPKLQEEASRELASIFPKYVKALQKETKTGWKGMKTRWDVRVQWRKCAKDSGAVETAESMKILKQRAKQNPLHEDRNGF